MKGKKKKMKKERPTTGLAGKCPQAGIARLGIRSHFPAVAALLSLAQEAAAHTRPRAL